MSYLKETEEVTKLRNAFCEMIRHGGCPSMCKMKMWAELKNAVIREAYAKAGKTTPPMALEPFGLKSARELIADLKTAYRKWAEGKMCQGEFMAIAHTLESDFEALCAHGRVRESDEDRFNDEYCSSLIAVTDIPETLDA